MADDFELRDGDRVVFVGNTFIERDQIYGYLETMLTARWPDRNVTFRNLGWSGDTVWGEARARFGTAADGFQHLKEHIKALQPTVIFAAYGMNESFEGTAGLPKFLDGFIKLLDMLAQADARVVLLSPNRHEHLGRPLPDPSNHNRDLQIYSEAIGKLAADRGYVFVDLFELLGDGARSSPPQPFTDNGIHLTAFGYWRAAGAVERGLGLEPPRWLIEFGPGGRLAKPYETELSNIAPTPAGVRFEACDVRLPAPPAPPGAPGGATLNTRLLRVQGLTPGKYVVRIDGKPVAEFKATDKPVLVKLLNGPEFEQVEKLRRTIVEKNRLYFHRWRPQNETYLFGFRKHEQGQNAAEVPRFDPLVEEMEAKIAKLRVPVKHTYELIRADENRDD